MFVPEHYLARAAKTAALQLLWFAPQKVLGDAHLSAEAAKPEITCPPKLQRDGSARDVA